MDASPSPIGLFLLTAIARLVGFSLGLLLATPGGRMNGYTYLTRMVVVAFLSLSPVLLLERADGLSPLEYRIAFSLLGTWIFILGMAAGMATSFRATDAGVSRGLVLPSMLPGMDVVVGLLLLTSASVPEPLPPRQLSEAEKRSLERRARIAAALKDDPEAMARLAALVGR